MRVRSHLFRLAAAACCLVCCLAYSQASSSPGELTPPVTVEWVFSMKPDPGNTTRPLVLADRVYVTHRGTLHCLDARTGAQQWEFSPEPGDVITSPIAWNNLIIVGASDATLYALEAVQGRQQWKHLCAGPISPDPLLLGDLLMAGAEKMVYAISPRSGEPEWQCSLTSPAKAGPVTDGSMLYFLCQDGSIQCVDMSVPRYRWSAAIERGPHTLPPIPGKRGVIVASGRQLFFISRGSGQSRAKEMPAGVGASPVVADDTLYVPCVDGEIYTLYPQSGARQDGPTLRVGLAVTSPPLVTPNHIVAGTASGLIYLLARDSGNILWSYRCLAPEQLTGKASELGIYAPMVTADGRLYCLTGTGDLYCFSASAPDSSGPRFADLQPEPGSALPGGASLTVSFAVTDDGSGLDASSLGATLDGAPAKLSFDAVSGLGTLALSSLADGPHVVKVTAQDYRGNVGTAEWSFFTDASLETEGQTGLAPRLLSLPSR